MTVGKKIALALAATSMSFSASALGRASSPPRQPPSARPNILLIILDDVGFSDLGAYGSEIHTPNIDALARGGLRYNRFDTKAICSATRASLLTGRNNQTVQMADLASHRRAPDPTDDTKYKGVLPDNAQTLAQALTAAGYQTYALGKWHLTPRWEGGPGAPAGDPGGKKTSWPLQKGFGHFYGFLGGWTDEYNPRLVEDNHPIPTPTTPGYHLSVDLADHAIADVDQNARSGKPFFLYLALGAGHAPIQAPKSYIDHYRDTYSVGWDAVRAARFRRMKQIGIIPPDTKMHAREDGDAAWSSLDVAHQRLYARYMATYAGFLEHADAQIGRLVDHLKATGTFNNTLIVVLSDNGAAGEGGADGGFRYPYNDKTPFAERLAHIDELGGSSTEPLYQRPWAMASDAPLRRYKGWPYSGGTRDPLIVTWPDRITDRGAVRPQWVDAIDIAPTLLDVAGTHFATSIDGVKQIPVAGASVRASFSSGTAQAGRSIQYFELRGSRAIRVGWWKAIAVHQRGTPFSDDPWQLFNEQADFGEAHDLSKECPQKLDALKAAWWEEARKYAKPPLGEPHHR